MQNNIPLTGPAAIQHALSKINLDGLREKHFQIIKSGAKSKRTKSVQALNAIEGAGGDLLGGAGGGGIGYLLGKLLSGKKNFGGVLARMAGTGIGGLVGTKMNDPWQQEELINKKLDLGYPQGLNLSVKK